MVDRFQRKNAEELLAHFPCLGILGPRQIGKTTFAKQLMQGGRKKFLYLDLESHEDIQKLEHAETFLREYENVTVIIDEVQRKKDLFPLLRSLIDRKRVSARFILLGSASPDLIREASESLAGRIAYLELSGILFPEVEHKIKLNALWLHGGYPDPLLHPKASYAWMNNYVKNYVERDLPLLGLSASPSLIRRLWTMLAHCHGQTLNYEQLSKSLEIDQKTVKRYIDFLEEALLVRRLQPYAANISKRLVKAPKIYLKDCGILHYFLNIENTLALKSHPVLGSSWEGFVIEHLSQLKSERVELNFYRSHNGAEMDVVFVKSGKACAAAEIKFGDKITPSRGNFEACETLNVQQRFLIRQEGDDFESANGFKIVSFKSFISKYLPKI